MKRTIFLLAVLSSQLGWAASLPAPPENQLSVLNLKVAESIALQSDFRLQAARSRLESSQALVTAEGQLPDPQLRLALLNLPTDSFDFNQEAMTQVFAGLKQSFPAGNSLEVRKSIAEAEASSKEASLQTYQATVLRELRQRWLKVYASQAELSYIDKERKILDSMIPAATGAYRAGKGTQTEVVKIQLKLAALNESEARLKGENSESRALLGQWFDSIKSRIWPDKLPSELLAVPAQDITNNPQIHESVRKITTSKQKVELAKQAYKPNWGVEAGYGLRDSRADFLSFGVTVSLPLFASQRQDHRLQASKANLAAVQLDEQHLRRELLTQLANLHAAVTSLDSRIIVYQNDILPELSRIQTLTKNDFRAGKTNFSSILEAQEAILKVEREQLLLELERAEKIIDIRFLTGESES